MTCIKTGARVRLENYDCVVSADLYKVRDAVVIRGNANMIENGNRQVDARATHTAFIPPLGEYYENTSIGILVLPASCVVEVNE